MRNLLSAIGGFLTELRRRKVYQVALAYVVVGFMVIEAADLTLVRLGLPPWTVTFVVVLVGLGFPIALVLAWALEVTPEGVRIEETEQAPEEGARVQGAPTPSLWVGASVLALLLVGAWWMWGGLSADNGSTESSGGRPEIEQRTIAVLPFEPLSSGEESETFARGVHDDLLTRLSNISDLKVISRTSVQQYRNTDLSLPAIADSLGARWVVDGGVLESGDRVQVNARLIDPRSDVHRWADSYERELTAENLFAIQGEITREIADALQAKLTAGEQERLVGPPTEDLEAYRLYVKGRQQLAGRAFGFQVGWRIFGEQDSPQSSAGQTVEVAPGEPLQRAVGYFRRAIGRDSSFALAWAGLADAAAWYRAEVSDSAAGPRVSQQAAARRALELGPDLAEAHASMGFVHLLNRDAPAAVRELTRALELKPSYWEAHHWLGELYLKIGRAQQALEHLTLAVELNPQHALARHWLYDTYLAAGQPEKSLREVRRQQRLGLEAVNAVAGEVRALYHLGRLEEARRLAQEQISKLGTQISKPRKGLWPVAMRGHLAAVLAAEGDTAGAREKLDWLRSEEAELFWIGFAHATVGETDRALEAWERMDVEAWGRIPAPHHLRYGILLDLAPLREDPRYRELIREANRYWGLNPDGSLPEDVDVNSTTAPEADA